LSHEREKRREVHYNLLTEEKSPHFWTFRGKEGEDEMTPPNSGGTESEVLIKKGGGGGGRKKREDLRTLQPRGRAFRIPH